MGFARGEFRGGLSFLEVKKCGVWMLEWVSEDNRIIRIGLIDVFTRRRGNLMISFVVGFSFQV